MGVDKIMSLPLPDFIYEEKLSDKARKEGKKPQRYFNLLKFANTIHKIFSTYLF